MSAPAQPQFIHLGVHSEYSLVDGLIRIDELVERAAALGMPAVALTDVCNFFALVRFYEAAQAQGVKPICGAEFAIATGEGAPARLTLLVQNETGYRNLTRLISRAYLEGQVRGRPTLRREWIAAAGEGLIALSGGRAGDIGQALLAGRADAEALLAGWMRDFPGRFYLELQRTGRPGEDDYLHRAVALAAARDCPVVATNDVCFLTPDQFEAHEARVCINEGRTLNDPRRERRYSDQQYLRSPAEMVELFDDLPEALANSVAIAQRCNLELKLGAVRLPDYPVPAGISTAEFFREHAEEGLDRRLAVLFDPASPDYPEQRAHYRERLAFELGVIEQMGFAGYFLIVMDFIRWARENDIPVGPGRGSGAGSLVAYALGITDLDPIAYDLLFERFLNPERVSMPDFDIDFCMDNRDRVIAYVAERYGREAVSQIITFGTMAAKAVVRDVARVQGKSYGLADKLSKMIPNELGITLDKARAQEEVLRDFLAADEEAQEIWDMAVQLEGLTRNAGKHAGGVVIAPGAITDFAPLYCDAAGENPVTQFDKDDVERVGLVKFDFLGLRTLTIIDWAVANANRERARSGLPPIDIARIPLDDAATYELLQQARTTAVFQLESRGIRELILRLRPSRFEDVVALVALFRPGPLQSGMVDDFIDRKHGRQPVAYPHPRYQHPDLKPVLEPTYGIILYQEQVMQIAQVLAGYSLGGADLLRRAMGKKKAEEMAEQRAVFLAGAVEKGIARELAENIFDLMEKFAGYGFNKSHSAAYALLAYQTAWLKVHHPAAFMAAVLSADMQNTDKVVTLIDECRAMGLRVAPPDVNAGLYPFSVAEDGSVIYGLGAIKGLGQGPVEAIIAAREQGGPFRDLFDFCARVDGRRLNKRVLDALVRAGAMDSLGPAQDARGQPAEIGYRRAVLAAAMEEAIRRAEQQSRDEDAGMGDLFGGTVARRPPEASYAPFATTRAQGVAERLRGEKETLGLYLTGHPLDEYGSELEALVPQRIANLRAGREPQRVIGLVVGTRTMKTRRGDAMCFVTLDDRSGRIEVALFAELYREQRDRIGRDAILVITGQVSEDDYTGGLKMRADAVQTLVEARRTGLKGLVLELRTEQLGSEQIDRLAAILAPFRSGGCPLRLRCRRPGAVGEIALPAAWALEPEDELLHRLRDNFGRDSLQLRY
ncbi:MAG TPA: DNA polymerase III subunit alpha [Porticoccaceae bacterium]|nr:DNA polymerase III subunit alpha [Porticoccaceae bacterium]